MSDSSIHIELDGNTLFPPTGWDDIGVLATFDNELQANLTVQDFRFILDSYQRLAQLIDAGTTGGLGIFEPTPLKLSVISSLGTQVVFDGSVKLSDAVRNDTEGYIDASVDKTMSLNTLDDRLQGLSYGLLVENGVITQADYVDVDYVVVSTNRAMEAIMISITIFMLAQQMIELIERLGNATATTDGIAVSGVTGPVGAAVFATINAIVIIAYGAALLLLMIDLATDLLAVFVPPQRTHKGILLKTLMEKACEHLGYGFNTTIADLDHVTFLASNNKLDETDGFKGFISAPGVITEGIPNASDYGYLAGEIFRAAKDTFYARYQLIDGVVEFHADNAPYWKRLAPWTMPDVLEGEYSYNTDELNDSVFIRFATDISDEWTIGNYKGTSYQVITSAQAVGPSGRDHITGLDEVSIPYALGNRKDELTGFEKFFKFLGSIIDTATGIFGGGTNIAGQIAAKVGILKVSSNNHSVPKLLWLENGRIPVNHRDLFGAKALWNSYHIEKSFIANGYNRQRKVFSGVEVPFGFADFVALIDNSYFNTMSGEEGKALKIEWNMAKDKAIMDFWIQKTYTTNLQETFIEQE